MTVRDIKNILEANVLTDIDKLDTEVDSACGSDMMSDVLAFVKDHSVLLTGLVNSQIVRTAEMMDMVCIVLVRGKMPDEEMIKLANSKGIILMNTKYRMYSACGILYENGLRGKMERDKV